MNPQEYWKILGQIAPAINTPTTLYTVPALRQTQVSFLSICNPNGGAVLVDFWVTRSGEAISPGNRVLAQLSLASHTTQTYALPFYLAAGDSLIIQSNTAATGFSAFGIETFPEQKI